MSINLKSKPDKNKKKVASRPIREQIAHFMFNLF